MALLKCVDCSGKVSTSAPACPHCGAPVPLLRPNASSAKIPSNWSQNTPPKIKKKKGLWIFAFFVFALILLLANKSEPTRYSSNNADQSLPPVIPRVATKEELANLPKEPNASGKLDPKRQREKRAQQKEYETTEQSLRIVYAQEAVLQKLKDPDSAKFKDVYFSKSSDNLALVCGKVNAKNAFGAFTGFKRFISNGVPETTFLEQEVEDFHTSWNRFC